MPPVPRSLRCRWLLVSLGVLALIGQLLLPRVHAQAVAGNAANPLLAAFCGEVAPQRLGALRQQLRSSLQRSDDAAAAAKTLKSACDLCLSLHGAALLPPAAGLPPLPRAAGIAMGRASARVLAYGFVPQPPQRGPPQRS